MTEKKSHPGIRAHHGKFQVRYWGLDRKQHSKSFDRLTDARRFQRKMESKKDDRTWTDPRAAQTPFDNWAETWLASRHKQGDAKRAKNESVLSRHVIGDDEHGFGSTQLGRIGQQQVQDWVNFMVEAGYQPSYIRSAYTLLAGILRGAAAARLIAEAPLQGVELPATRRKRERFLSSNRSTPSSLR